MPTFLVTFEREVTEVAEFFVQAEKQSEAIEAARSMLTEHDWRPDEIIPGDETAQVIPA
jgi:hypothetical protein